MKKQRIGTWGLAMTIALLSTSLFAAEKTLTVISEGIGEKKSEKVVIHFHFSGYGWTVKKAQSKADRNIDKFLKKLSKEKIPLTKTTLEDIRLKPSYQFNRDLNAKVPSDFLVSRKVSLELEDFASIGRLMDVSLSVGSFVLESAILTVKDKKDLRQNAFENALKEGKLKAEKMAKAFEAELGPILSIEELESEIKEINLIQDGGFASLASGAVQTKTSTSSGEKGSEDPASKESPSLGSSAIEAISKIKIIFSFK